MTVSDICQLLKALKEANVTSFELDGDAFEVHFSHEAKPAIAVPEAILDTPVPPQVQNGAAVERLKDLISTLSLPDDKLLDKIFPNGAGGEA